MFARLRNKILLLNMALTSVVIILAFAAIFFINRSDIFRENSAKLTAAASNEFSDEDPPSTEIFSGIGDVSVTSMLISPSDAPAFNIDTDDDGVIKKIYSPFDMSREVYEQAAGIAWKNGNVGSAGMVRLDGRLWQYSLAERNVSVAVTDEETGEIRPLDSSGWRITFLDVTESMAHMDRLLITFICAVFVILAAVFCVSLMFANRAISPLADAWEKQRQFIADASHELKTPLTVISANYDALMANENETVASQTKWLTYMKSGMDRMSGLIRDLLDLAKMESGTGALRRESFNVSERLINITHAMYAAADGKNLKFSEEIESDIHAVSEAELVERVFTVLCENAVKYAEDNGQIKVSLKRVKKQIVCTVKNTGGGISPRDLPHIFERFYRADASRGEERSGYGLGLAIAKQSTEALGGSLTAESENGMTSFVFAFDAHL